MRKIKALILSLLLNSWLFAYSGDILHEYIIIMDQFYSYPEVCQMHLKFDLEIDILNEGLNIYYFKFKSNSSTEEELKYLKSDKKITKIIPNRKLEQRACKPNDPHYNMQWNSRIMGFEDLWCFSNNGVTPLGDTIVLGIVDFGCNCDIDEFSPNLFVNHKEIPDNKIDDDGNGFTDDYRGFSARQKGDDHPVDNHGTNVLSIAGSIANNNKLIAGAAPNIKLLMCSAIFEHELIKCYSYFIKMKQDYISTNGKSGAFVLASSTSLGDDGKFPKDNQAWCDMYDLMSTAGISSFVATTNKNVFIDTAGDMPGLCPSQYLVVVTSTNKLDARAGTGFSKTNIDIGASGDDVPVIGNSGDIEIGGGTSFATPQIAAAAAYLNQFCEKYANICKNDPEQGVSLMRKFILTGGKKIQGLTSETSSGNRFNAKGAYDKLIEFCFSLSNKNDLKLYIVQNSNSEIKYDIELTELGSYVLELYNLQGKLLSSTEGQFDGTPIKNRIFRTKFLSPGIHLLALRFGDEVISRKFLSIY